MSDVDELVKRLRASDAHPLSIHGQTMTEAADALEAQAKEMVYLKERLRLTNIDWGIGDARIAELEAVLDHMHKGHDALVEYIAELEAALKPFADASLEYDEYKDSVHINENDFITVSDLRAAHTALKGEKG